MNRCDLLTGFLRYRDCCGVMWVAWLFARLILFAIGYIILTTSIGCFPICFGGRRWNTFQ
nr:MAG TPA: N-terminal domain of cytochrome oxidase-cbb3, FixP [Caudoviricetes sp.]